VAEIAVQPGISTGASAEDGTKRDQDRSDDEKKAFEHLWLRAILDEPPDDVVRLDQVGKKRSTNNQLMDQRLVKIFEVRDLHRCWANVIAASSAYTAGLVCG